MFTPQKTDFSLTKMFSAENRRNLVRIDNLAVPGTEDADFASAELERLIDKLRAAKRGNKLVTCFIGAHVIKCGLSRYIIRLMEEGYITHLASNGAGSIHDFELAYLGGTSEDVPTAIEDGSFGMWDETGRLMNAAIRRGHAKGWGYGQSLAEFVDAERDAFPYADDCLFYRGYSLGVPVTYHVAIGCDIIHQHPDADFSAIGGTSGTDFAYFCKSVSELEGGVHMNVGSAVTGPEVFLKALSISRNQGQRLADITTANFDMIPLGDYASNVPDTHFHYYYRPRKNIVNRPVSLGGTGLNIEGNHKRTIPSLYAALIGKKAARD